MSNTTERNIAIGGVVILLLFLLLRRASAKAGAASVAPPLPDEDKLVPSTFSPDDYIVETLQNPKVPTLSFIHEPQQPVTVKIVPPKFQERIIGPVKSNYPMLELKAPSYQDLAYQDQLPRSTFDRDGIGSSFGSYSPSGIYTYSPEGELTLINQVPVCEC